MTTMLLSADAETPNPLEIAEDVIIGMNLPFDRINDEELAAEISTQWCTVKLWFSWRPEIGAMIFSCLLDARVPEKSRSMLYPLLGMVNEKLWLGHFEISEEDGHLVFRHTQLMRGSQEQEEELLEDMVDIALTECERFYPAFQSVLWGGKNPKEAMELSLFDTMGEA